MARLALADSRRVSADILVEISSADYFAERHPVLDAIRK
jgi:hypothetical protein